MRPFQCQPECRPCLERLVLQITEASTDDEDLQRKLIQDGESLIEREFNPDCIPSRLTTKFLRHAKQMTGCQDPFAERKNEEMKHGRDAFRCLQTAIEDAQLNELIRFAALANSIDIFTSLDEIMTTVNGDFTWGVSDLGRLGDFFKKADKLFLYLADNAGEMFFDAPLFQAFNSIFQESHYVVKGKPAQNDITREDLLSVDMLDSFPSVITHGFDTVGLNTDELNGSFLQLYEKAGFILAKGMGHYETLSRIERRGRTLFLLKAKCKPVADSIGIEEGTYAAFIQ